MCEMRCAPIIWKKPLRSALRAQRSNPTHLTTESRLVFVDGRGGERLAGGKAQ